MSRTACGWCGALVDWPVAGMFHEDGFCLDPKDRKRHPTPTPATSPAPARTVAATPREQKILAARRLRTLGWTAPAIGRALGVSDSTIRNWYLGGTCVDCGAPVEKSSHAHASTRCQPCRKVWEIGRKVWTREAVIGAIQRWAREHGKPPTANDWLHADPDRGYPNRGSCYRTAGAQGHVPFVAWADAIEAAGFPRPRVGVYENTPEVRQRQSDGQKRRRERERRAREERQAA